MQLPSLRYRTSTTKDPAHSQYWNMNQSWPNKPRILTLKNRETRIPPHQVNYMKTEATTHHTITSSSLKQKKRK